jgi:hypothetical protein
MDEKTKALFMNYSFNDVFLFESAGNFDDRKTLHNVTVQQLQNRTKCVEGQTKIVFCVQKKNLFTLRDNRNL